MIYLKAQNILEAVTCPEDKNTQVIMHVKLTSIKAITFVKF